VLPGDTTACAMTGGGARPDSTPTGFLPWVNRGASGPGPDEYLLYPPISNALSPWNATANYAGACPALSSANAGQWKLKLVLDATHTVTLDVFTVDTTA